jgi:hypothetical protein
MTKVFAVLAVLVVGFGTALSAVPANASTTYLFQNNHNEGGANN